MVLNDNIKPWLFRVEPLEGESLSHFLGRVRRRNHLSCYALGELGGIGGAMPKARSAIARWEKFRHNPFPSDFELIALGNLLGLDLNKLKAMLPSESMKLEPIRLCGVCYGESPCHRIEWQYKSVWKCDKHQLKLLSKCPQCGARFKIPSLWEFGQSATENTGCDRLVTEQCCDRCGLFFSVMGTYQTSSIKSR